MHSADRLAAGALAASLLAAPSLSAQVQQTGRIAYPPTRTVDVVDDYFGRRVADPYRWLEELDAPEVADWVKAQNAVTFEYLETLPLRESFRRRITELWNYPKVTIPVREGGLLFYRKNSGLERQSRVFVRRSVDAEPSLLLDPNAMFPDGSVSLGQVAPSPDGALVAYTLSEGGADWQTVHVRDIATGRDRPDSVRWMRFSGLSWTKDGKGFFYSRYPEPPEGKALEAALTGHAIYYHRVGTPQSADRLIYERKDLPTWFVFGSVTEDGRYLLVSISRGADNTNRLYAAGLGDPLHPNVAAPVRPVVELDGAEYSPVGSDGSTVFVRSDADAPNRKILAIELRDPRPVAWRTIVPEGQQAIEGASVIGGRLVLQYLDDVKSRVRFFSLRGEAEGELALPGVGTVVGISGRQDSPELFYAYTSPLYPTTVFSYDAASGRSTPFEAATPPIDVDRYETKQLFATSKDGTRIPFFLTMRRDLKRDGANPTLLYAYGGFSVSLTPSFSPSVPAWLELGGIYVTANLRGGGEYGEAWHRAGMLDRKQNVFDDFIAVAEYLVKEGYTSPARLGIEGGSNGGLLVGAAMEQRPDLFAVAFPGVGVMDMLRYDRFTGGRAWVTEYGSSSDRAQFETLFRYSPLHNIRTGVCYPATLVTTADHDDRVVPSHSFKFVATLQRAQACARPVLVRVETQGSHGYRPTDKRIAEIADIYAFAAAQTGMKAPLPRP